LQNGGYSATGEIAQGQPEAHNRINHNRNGQILQSTGVVVQIN